MKFVYAKKIIECFEKKKKKKILVMSCYKRSHLLYLWMFHCLHIDPGKRGHRGGLGETIGLGNGETPRFHLYRDKMNYKIRKTLRYLGVEKLVFLGLSTFLCVPVGSRYTL